MMHKWESTEKLLPQWEHQAIGEQELVYEDFKYKQDEFDNVPPVVPRFLFYLQLNIKPICEQLTQLLARQSVASLKQETLGWLEEERTKHNAQKEVFEKVNSELQARCDSLQAQIDQMHEQQKAREASQKTMAADNLWGAEGFNFESAKFKDQFERNNCLFKDKIGSAKWQEPRMFSLQQLRNSFQSMLHQSSVKMSLDDAIQKTALVMHGQTALEEMDK